ncbi:MAG: hypothetical protein JNL70_03885 [Saprospiraceae bacterium]|nr:hypothetical protein [Saprospiraceae bacterium]
MNANNSLTLYPLSIFPFLIQQSILLNPTWGKTTVYCLSFIGILYGQIDIKSSFKIEKQ